MTSSTATKKTSIDALHAALGHSMHVNRMQNGYSQTRHIRAGLFTAFPLLAFLLHVPVSLTAQTGEHPFSPDAAEVSGLSFEGNRSFSGSELRELLATKTTP